MHRRTLRLFSDLPGGATGTKFSVNKLAIAPDRCKAYSFSVRVQAAYGKCPLTKIGVWVDDHLNNMAYVACVREKNAAITV